MSACGGCLFLRSGQSHLCAGEGDRPGRVFLFVCRGAELGVPVSTGVLGAVILLGLRYVTQQVRTDLRLAEPALQ